MRQVIGGCVAYDAAPLIFTSLALYAEGVSAHPLRMSTRSCLGELGLSELSRSVQKYSYLRCCLWHSSSAGQLSHFLLHLELPPLIMSSDPRALHDTDPCHQTPQRTLNARNVATIHSAALHVIISLPCLTFKTGGREGVEYRIGCWNKWREDYSGI